MQSKLFSFALFLTVLLSGNVGATGVVSTPCGGFLQELATWGIQFDRTLELTPSPIVSRPYNGQLPADRRILGFEDMSFPISSDKVPQLAAALSLGGDSAAIEGKLREALAGGQSKTSLIPFLPESVRNRLGRADTHSCYNGAFNFNEDWNAVNPSISLDTSMNLDNIFARYTDLGFGATLRFGDILLFRRFPDPGKPLSATSFHAAVYIGGDIIYQKYSPAPVFHYEFTTMENLIRIYSNPDVGAMQELMAQGVLPGGHLLSGSHRFGQAFLIQFLRFDPDKRLPLAARNPNVGLVPPPDHSMDRLPATSALRPAVRVVSPPRSDGRVGRNDPCPCGSGKKFKKCHGVG